MEDEEKADAIANHMQAQDHNGPVSVWKKVIELCVVIMGAVLGFILLYCLVTLTTIMVVSMFLLINTLIHLLKSIAGKSSHRKVVSPISDGGATIILVLAIVMLSMSLWIVRAVDSREHRVLFGGGLQVRQWIEFFITLLGYCIIRNGIQVMVNPYQVLRPWLQGLVESIYCLLLIPTVLLVMKVVPSWKHRTLLGLLVWKWICAVILIILGQNAISLAMFEVKQVSRAWCHYRGCKGQNCVYYYIKGLRRTLAFVAVALMHLLTWWLYFRPHFVKHSSVMANTVSDFGTWTFVTELICAFLWLIKNFILLSWQAHTVYERPEKEFFYQKSDKNDEILMRKLTYWCCLYSLGLIDLRGGRPPMATEIEQDNEYSRQSQQQQKSWPSFIWEHYKFKTAYDFLRATILVSTQEENNKVEWKIKKHKWGKAITTLIELVHDGKHSISIHTKKKIARAFLLDDRSLPEDHHISSLYEKLYNEKNMVDKEIAADKLDVILDEYVQLRSKMHGRITKTDDKILKRETSAANILKQEVLKTGQESIRHHDFQALTEKAHQNCLQFRYFLVSAQNVVNFLNRLMIGFVIVLGIIMWLLLTEILPTKVIVVITSPILAATFIFGDTIKTIFQGIVFAYFSHPFTIGHLCVIDKTQMEVKKIGIWRTTFSKLGTEEEVLYPNSDLATKAIINYGRNLQLLQEDYAEFSLKYGTNRRRIKDLSCSINNLVRQENSKTSDSKNNSPRSEKENIDQHKNTKNRSDDSVALQKESNNFGVTRSASLPAGRESMREETMKIVRSASIPENMHSTRQKTIKVIQSASDDEPKMPYYCTRRNGEDIKWDDVVVKQIEGNIKMSFNFKHGDSMLDMTNAQAFNEILRKKSLILRQIADLICIQ